MVKGLSIKFKSYHETIPKLLEIIKFGDELKKHDRVVLKPNLIRGDEKDSTPPEFVEAILKFCMENKNAGTEIFIAEGSDGKDTMSVFHSLGYRNLAEKYDVTLLDLNKVECEEIEDEGFMAFRKIMYPKILKESFVVSLPVLRDDWETGMAASLDNMVGAFPSRYYSGLFSSDKNKIKRHDIRHVIHDIIRCKSPDFAIIDSSEKGVIIAGHPIEMDKQAARLLGFELKNLPHLKLIEESLSP